jgi:hypothetical protein
MMTKGKIYGCTALSSGTTSPKSKKSSSNAGFLILQAELDQLPSQLAQGMRLKIKSKPTAYIM